MYLHVGLPFQIVIVILKCLLLFYTFSNAFSSSADVKFSKLSAEPKFFRSRYTPIYEATLVFTFHYRRQHAITPKLFHCLRFVLVVSIKSKQNFTTTQLITTVAAQCYNTSVSELNCNLPPQYICT